MPYAVLGEVKLEMIGDHRQLQPSIMQKFAFERRPNKQVSWVASPQIRAIPVLEQIRNLQSLPNIFTAVPADVASVGGSTTWPSPCSSGWFELQKTTKCLPQSWPCSAEWERMCVTWSGRNLPARWAVAAYPGFMISLGVNLPFVHWGLQVAQGDDNRMEPMLSAQDVANKIWGHLP